MYELLCLLHVSSRKYNEGRRTSLLGPLEHLKVKLLKGKADIARITSRDSVFYSFHAEFYLKKSSAGIFTR
jgi:hypothetical protein